MGNWTGTYSRRPLTFFDETKRYYGILQQTSVSNNPKPITDADINDMVLMQITQLQRTIQQGFGDGSANSGFKISVSAVSTTNNFRVGGSTDATPTLENAGRAWVGGIQAFLINNIDWNTQVVALTF